MKKFEEVAHEELQKSEVFFEEYNGNFIPSDEKGLLLRKNGRLILLPWLKFARDWISPEDHQKVVDDLTNARSSITNLMAQLDYYKKDKRFEAMAEEILSLKSQIEKQQPEIPEFMANYIEAAKEDFWTLLSAMDDSNLSSRVGDWLKGGNFRNQEIFAQAWTNGYTVKEKRFYLKHIDFCKRHKDYDWYMIKHSDGPLNHLRVEKGTLPPTVDTYFTQQEIDSMETGSYEQIEVEE